VDLILDTARFEGRLVRIVRLREGALRNRTAPYPRLRIPPTSESFLSPAQPGLSFEVNLNLQNLDERIGS
jgi:hypothetical protein